MREEDLTKARALLKTKRDIRCTLAKTDKTLGETAYVRIGNIELELRCSTLKEFLDKELNYVNRMLKSLGTTELT